jgi:hypothetical protein
MHDSLDSLSFDDERRQIGRLIVHFVRRVDFGRDLEAQLNQYADFRQVSCACSVKLPICKSSLVSAL